MRLVVDTSVLAGELLRESGRVRLGDDRLELYLPEDMWGEARIELPRRITAYVKAHGLEPRIGDAITEVCLAAVDSNVVVIDRAIYSAVEVEARARSLRDPHDWPAVACAILLTAGVWTNDNDFLGTGVPTWATETLKAWLDRHPAG